MAKYTSAIQSGIAKFEYTDNEDGEIIAHAKLNVGSIHLLERLTKFQQEIGGLKIQTEGASVDDILRFEDEIEDKFCTFFGYDCKEDLFGVIAAIDTLGNGEMWCQALIEDITAKLEPELDRINAEREQAVAKYTKNYE